MTRAFDITVLNALSALILALGLAMGAGAAPRQNYLVIGVIASATPGDGVVLLKSLGGSQAFAVRVGQEFDGGVSVVRVTREFVYVRIDQRTEKIRVGEQVDVVGGGAPEIQSLKEGGMERHGNKVKIAAAFRDEIVKRQLSKVMMQAAAVPYYEGSVLTGFRLWDIDPESIFDRAGIVDGDIVKAINGQPLSDVGRTIKLLHSLREETRIEVTYVRKGQPMTIEVVVE